MIIDKDHLESVIGKVVSATENKGLIEEMSHFVFKNSSLMAYNDKIIISHPLDFEGDGIEASVVASTLISALKSAKTKVELTTKDTHLEMKSKGVKSKIPFYENDHMAELLNTLKIKKARKNRFEIQEDLLNGLDVCKSAASDNLDNQKGLYCVGAFGTFLFASSGFEAIKYNLENEVPYFFIKRHFIEPLLRFIPTSMYITNNWLFFFNEEEGMFCCKASDVEDVFPKLSHIEKSFPSNLDGSFEMKIDSEMGALVYFAEGTESIDKTMRVIVNSETKKVTIIAKNDKGEIIFKGKANSKEDHDFQVNPNLFKNLSGKDGKYILTRNSISVCSDTFIHMVGLKTGE